MPRWAPPSRTASGSTSRAGRQARRREIEFVKVDDESDPAKATDNVNKLIKRDNVDVLVGTVHSGRAMAMAKVAKDTGTLLIVPNAGADAVTGPCARQHLPQLVLANWQPGYAMGEVVAKKGHKNVVTITWKYAAGDESVRGFKEAFEKAGGKVVKEPAALPNVEFQALLTEIAASKPDAVFTFFAGGGAVQVRQGLRRAGLKKSIPLYGAGFLTDGTLEAQGADADGLLTTLHYADGLGKRATTPSASPTPRPSSCSPTSTRCRATTRRRCSASAWRREGDVSKKAEVIAAAIKAKIDSPRGAFTLSPVAQPGAGHLPAPGGRQGEQAGRRQGLVRPRLQDVSLADPAAAGQPCGAGTRQRCRGSWRTFLIQCLNSLQYGLLLFLVASGLTLIFGIMGVINLAHGSFYMIGAYMAFALAPDVAATFGGGFFATLRWARRWRCCWATCSRWAFFSFLYEARAPAAGADDLRPDPGVRGTAQPAGRRRRARRASRRPVRHHPARRADDLSGLSPVHLGGVPGCWHRGHVPRPRTRGWA